MLPLQQRPHFTLSPEMSRELHVRRLLIDQTLGGQKAVTTPCKLSFGGATTRSPTQTSNNLVPTRSCSEHSEVASRYQSQSYGRSSRKTPGPVEFGEFPQR